MYVLIARTGFCDYFVYSLDKSSTIRLNAALALAARFRTADDARRHAEAGEEPFYVGGLV